jgi:hypothetical protein
MATKKVVLTNIGIIVGSPGEIITVYGHNFTIQPDLRAVGEIEEDFVEQGVAAGRFRVLGDESKQTTPLAKKELLESFSFEIEDYFGADNINEFIDKIKEFKNKNQIILFAETRLNLSLPQSMAREKMVEQISDIVRLANTKTKLPEEFDTLQTSEKRVGQSKTISETQKDLNELENKLKKNSKED